MVLSRSQEDPQGWHNRQDQISTWQLQFTTAGNPPATDLLDYTYFGTAFSFAFGLGCRLPRACRATRISWTGFFNGGANANYNLAIGRNTACSLAGWTTGPSTPIVIATTLTLGCGSSAKNFTQLFDKGDLMRINGQFVSGTAANLSLAIIVDFEAR